MFVLRDFHHVSPHGLVEQAQGVAVCSVGAQASNERFGARLLISQRLSFLFYKREILATVSTSSTQQIFKGQKQNSSSFSPKTKHSLHFPESSSSSSASSPSLLIFSIENFS